MSDTLDSPKYVRIGLAIGILGLIASTQVLNGTVSLVVTVLICGGIFYLGILSVQN